VWSRRANGGPSLSHFIVPRTAAPNAGLVRALAERFADPSIGRDPHIRTLMQRVLRLGAGAHEQSLQVPREFEQSAHRKRVVIVPGRAHGLRCLSGSGRSSISAMYAAARREYPDADIWLWPSAQTKQVPSFASHPDGPGVISIAPPGSNLLAALSKVACLYTVDSIEGLYGLLASVRVRVFGKPFYAGWGLSEDEHEMPDRVARPTIEALFDALYLRLACYVDPVTRRPGKLDTVLDAIDLQRAVQRRYADLGKLAAMRIQLWKRQFVAPFIAAGGGNIRWSNKPCSVQSDERAVLWGARTGDDLPSGTRVVRIEDGFLHSWGLGSDMIAPRSQVVDREGIYFDPRRPSELSRILNEAHFDEHELARAAALRHAIRRASLTKYNLGRRVPSWRAPESRRIILVIGQVGDDASIRFGTGKYGTVDALLDQVRVRNPDAFLVYKPHPDVLSGNRQGLIDAQSIADVIDTHSDLISLIEVVDEVHTLSSLAGFDALLRDRQVFTYGLPFYAGWGLTTDALEPVGERKRTLTLDMLVAGALIRYPLYWDWQTRMFTSPEAVVADLASRANRPFDLGASGSSRFAKKAFRWSRNVLLYACEQGSKPLRISE
jgi:capsular polysaccharide export protein